MPFGLTTRRLFFLSFVALAWLLARQWEARPIVHPAGVLIEQAPLQVPIDSPRAMPVGEFRLTPRARFKLRARVLSAHRYYLGMEARLSPLDLALGWGPMSDQAVLDRIEISQSGRWYRTRYEYPAPVSDERIIRSSSNMHMIPAGESVERALKKLRPGDLVSISGQLVDVDHDSGWAWRTSLRRDDTGAGACEIVWVEYLQVD